MAGCDAPGRQNLGMSAQRQFRLRLMSSRLLSSRRWCIRRRLACSGWTGQWYEAKETMAWPGGRARNDQLDVFLRLKPLRQCMLV